jgi:diguanylate cyclase (GGDEF)-like protein
VSESLFAIDPTKTLSQHMVTTWTEKEGLPTNTIIDIIQDKQGYIWMASYSGLIRFDGYKFTLFNKKTNETINSNTARTLLEDGEGNLWIGTNSSGLVKEENGTFSLLSTEQGLPDNSIRAMTFDKEGVLWIGTAGGIAKMEDGIISKYPVQNEQYGITTFLLLLQNGDLITGSNKPGLYKITDEGLVLYSEDPRLSSFQFSSAENGKDGTLWLGTSTGEVLSLKNETINIYENFSISGNSINKIFSDSHGIIWFGTDRGILYYKDNQLFSFSENEGLSSNMVASILEDYEGNLWVATERGGVSKFSNVKFRNFTTTEGLVNSSVNAVFTDKQGGVWIGTDSGLDYMYNNTFIRNAVTEELSNFRIRHIFQDRKGSLWFSTYSAKGLIKYDGNKFTNYSNENGLPTNRIRMSYEDSSGKIWIATTAGLGLLDNNEIKVFTIQDGLSNDYIMDIKEDKNGIIWLSTDGGGINTFDGVEFTSITQEQGLPSGVIFKTYEDKEGLIWICSNDGLSLYDNGKISVFTSKDGLFTDTVFQLMEDELNQFWIISDKGVMRIPRLSFLEYLNGEIPRLEPVLYDESDGLSGTLTGTGWAAINEDQKILLPTFNGISIFDSKNFQTNEHPPPVFIEEIKVDGNTIDFDKPITLLAGTLRTTFSFTALSYLMPEKVLFKYKLEGYDREWSDFSTERTATYTNLSPGNYTFYVTAQNNDGIINDKNVTVKIFQKPYFYQNKYYYIPFAILLVIGTYVIYSLRVRQIIRYKEILENKVTERTEKLAFANEELERLSMIDKLTQVYNRLKLDLVFEQEMKRMKRYPENPLSVILLDLDKFKTINDTYGHYAGDRVLINAAEILKKSIRDTDTLGRWGGEEFLIICTNTDGRGAAILAENLRNQLELYEFPEIENNQGTASFGISEYKKDDRIEDMLIRADKALYKAKNEGRNRVEIK